MERHKTMLEGRLLAMTILFFAAIATMAPLAFFAGLDRGRNSFSAHAADLAQNETGFAPSTAPPVNHSASVTICDDDAAASQALANIHCGAATPDEAPRVGAGPSTTSGGQSKALRNTVIASISNLEDPRSGEPLGLAMALDTLTTANQTEASAPFEQAGFPGGSSIPGSLAPFVPIGAATPSPPTSPAPQPTDPGQTPPPPTAAPPSVTPPTEAPPPIEPIEMVVPLPAAIPLFFSGLAFLLAITGRKPSPGARQ